MDACPILIMAIKREELSQTNWVYQDGTTRLLELDTTNGVNIRATAKAGNNFLVTAPAAGSIIIKTWKTADGTDPTPTAATGFSKKVNWIAVGT